MPKVTEGSYVNHTLVSNLLEKYGTKSFKIEQIKSLFDLELIAKINNEITIAKKAKEFQEMAEETADKLIPWNAPSMGDWTFHNTTHGTVSVTIKEAGLKSLALLHKEKEFKLNVVPDYDSGYIIT